MDGREGWFERVRVIVRWGVNGRDLLLRGSEWDKFDLNGNWCYNFNVTISNLWEEAPSITLEAARTIPLLLTNPTPEAPMSATTPLPVEALTHLSPKLNIGGVNAGNCKVSWADWMRSWCSRCKEIIKLTTLKKRYNYCSLKILTSLRKIKTWSNLSSRRTEKSKTGRPDSRLKTPIPALPKPKRRRCSTTWTSKTKNIKFKLKNSSLRYGSIDLDHKAAKRSHRGWQPQKNWNSSAQKPVWKWVDCSNPKFEEVPKRKHWDPRAEH